MPLFEVSSNTSTSQDNVEASVSFVKDIQLMMYGLGDCPQPLIETAELIEEIVLRQMMCVVNQAKSVVQMRGQDVITPEDILFLMRNDHEGLKRLIEYLGVKDERQMINKSVSQTQEDPEAGYVSDDNSPMTWQKSRKQYCFEFLKGIGITELEIERTEDSVKQERLVRANQTTLHLSTIAYSKFQAARQASFGAAQVTPTRFIKWLKLRGGVSSELKAPVLEILVYLAKETIARIIDKALILREESSVYSMVLTDTPPSTPLNLSEMMGDELDLDEFDDLEEISFDDLEQLSDDSQMSMEDSPDEDQETSLVDDALVTLKEHTGSIFCCHIDPRDGLMAVTGGEDETVYFWNTEEGEVIFEGTGFKDSVVGVEFSHDGKHVAAGDMGGVLKVWKVLPPNPPQEVWTVSVDEIMWIKWHHKSNILLCGVFPGQVFMWKIPSGECKVLTGHGVSSDIGQFMPDGKRAVVGYKDGVVKVYDLGSCNVSYILQNPELDCILCLATHPDNNLVAAGSINTKVALFSTQTGKVTSLFTCLEERESEDFRESVESIAFSKEPSLPFLVVGTISAVVIWDFAKQVIRHRYLLSEGVTKLLWDLQGPLVYIGTQDGEVKVMDTRLAVLVASLRGHKSGILDMSFSRDGKKLITASDDKTAKIFSIGSTPTTS